MGIIQNQCCALFNLPVTGDEESEINYNILAQTVESAAVEPKVQERKHAGVKARRFRCRGICLDDCQGALLPHRGTCQGAGSPFDALRAVPGHNQEGVIWIHGGWHQLEYAILGVDALHLLPSYDVGPIKTGGQYVELVQVLQQLVLVWLADNHRV